MSAVLSERGLEVLTGENTITADLPFEQQVDEMIRRADAAVFLLSGRPGLWVMREIDMVLDRKLRHIVPLLVGASTELPVRLRELEPVRVPALDQLEPVIEEIIGRIQLAERGISK